MILNRFCLFIYMCLLTGVFFHASYIYAYDSQTVWIPQKYKTEADKAISKNPQDIPEHVLLQHGLAMVFPTPDADLSMLYTLEKQAIKQKTGMWKDDYYYTTQPEKRAATKNHIQIVTATIHDASMQKDWLYLNFGEDWKTDFTVGIPKPDLYIFRKHDIDPTTWVGKTVHVRGWLTQRNGPFIKVTHPVQIQID